MEKDFLKKLMGRDTEIQTEEPVEGEDGERIIEPANLGLTKFIHILADDLLELSQKEELDKEKKLEYYEKIIEQLSKVEYEIKDDMKHIETMESTESDKVTDMCAGIDENLTAAQNLFLEAIGLLREFSETESPDLIEKVKGILFDAQIHLNRGDELSQEMEAIAEDQESTI